MSIVRSTLRTRIVNMADANGSTRWTVTAGTGEVDQHMGVVHTREWRRILNANPYYRVNKLTPATDASGNFALTALDDTSAPDAVKNHYRILLVSFGSVAYSEILAKDALISSTNSNGPYRSWYLLGLNIVVPDAPSTTATGVWVNYLPTRADLLSSDSVSVDFPADYENILTFETAALMLAKGGLETGAAMELKNFARELRDEMLQDIARLTIKPWVFQFPDTAHEYGG